MKRGALLLWGTQKYGFTMATQAFELNLMIQHVSTDVSLCFLCNTEGQQKEPFISSPAIGRRRDVSYPRDNYQH